MKILWQNSVQACVGIKGNPRYLNHELLQFVKIDSSFWIRDDVMHITLQKREKGHAWAYPIVGQALLCQVSSLRTFSLDKLQYWRESTSGISSLAHFTAKDTIDHFITTLKPGVYLSLFYFFTNMRSSFLDNYIVLLSLVYCVTGMGYAFHIFFNPSPAQLFSVLVPVCLTMVSGQSIRRSVGLVLKFIARLSYPKWVLEAFVIANAKRYYGVWLIQRCGVLMGAGFSLDAWKLCIVIIILFGVIAFAGMVTLQKK